MLRCQRNTIKKWPEIVCLSHQEIVILPPVSLFFNEVPCLYSQIAKTCRKIFALWKIRIYDRLLSGIARKKNAQNQHLWSFLIKTPIKKFSEKALLDHNMTRHKNFKNIYNRKRMTLSKASNSSFLTCLCSSSCKFFDAVLSIFKTKNFSYSENGNMTCTCFL